MHWKNVLGLVLISGTLFQPARCAPVVDENTRLQAAMKFFDSDPAQADKQLQALKSPSAKVFRAYLYFIKKVPAPTPSSVDNLMNQAIAEAKTKGSLGEMDTDKKYHYKDLETLLTHLRFITDADGGPTIPASIFRYYPVAAFDAFGPAWGSSRDGWLTVQDQPDLDVTKLPDVKDFVALLEELTGDPNDTCSGSIRSMYGRKQRLALMKASLGPTMFLPGSKAATKGIDPELNDFMDNWSNEELWNKVKYKQYMLFKGKAQQALEKYYATRLQLTADKASECSKNAIETISAGYLSEYSHSTMQESRARPVYKLCTNPKVTVSDLENGKLTPADFSDGLRYCILNNADVSTISWFISKGASLAGGLEEPLFTAVLRPDVVDILLKAGAKATAANAVGKTALFQAIQFDSLESVKKLIAAGLKPSQTMVAVDSDAATEANSSCVYNYSVGSRTPLHYAAMFASAPVIQYLVDQGADVSAKDSAGETAATMIAKNKNLSQAEREKLKTVLQHR